MTLLRNGEPKRLSGECVVSRTKNAQTREVLEQSYDV